MILWGSLFLPPSTLFVVCLRPPFSLFFPQPVFAAKLGGLRCPGVFLSVSSPFPFFIFLAGARAPPLFPSLRASGRGSGFFFPPSLFVTSLYFFFSGVFFPGRIDVRYTTVTPCILLAWHGLGKTTPRGARCGPPPGPVRGPKRHTHP